MITSYLYIRSLLFGAKQSCFTRKKGLVGTGRVSPERGSPKGLQVKSCPECCEPEVAVMKRDPPK
jgi:hypothetical protein